MSTFRTCTTAVAFILAGTFAAAAQEAKPATGPHPDQSGADTSMSRPQPVPGQSSEGTPPTTSTAPAAANAERPVPSPQNDAAKYNAKVAERDKQPLVAWTFGLDDPLRETLLRDIMKGGATAPASSSAKVEGVTPAVSEILPSQVELRPVPPTLTQQAPNARHYAYAMVGDSLVIADPNNRVIVAVMKRQ